MFRSLFAAAAIVSTTAVGAETMPTDISTLTWLDSNLTFGWGNQRILDETVPGGLFEGWRPATAAEVMEHVAQFAGAVPAFGSQTVYAQGTLGAMRIGYETYTFPFASFGAFQDPDGATGVFAVLSQRFCDAWWAPTCGPSDSFQISFTSAAAGGTEFTSGPWQLVAPLGTPLPAVPEPAAYVFLGAGIAAISLIRRRSIHQPV